ncbi:MAG: tRNA pseudouridine(55) synthase TruB [Planctomycetes bacterium]|nr:tRNA pseudouridine(55) synthase TruB [Planctomycetota bacterium]
MFGILNVNKPTGWTSRDVVNRVQRLGRPAKAGHAGTLDPLATGVLVVCVGPATRLISYVQQMPKTYEATFLLGRTSPSEDTETEVTELTNAPEPSLAEIEAHLPQFQGTIDQRPPAYSALKVKGQRAYKLAREGQAVELKSRPVEIYELALEEYLYPELRLTIHCGSGTYVRSLGRDLAESLDTGAVMSALVRTAIGDFCVDDALDIEQLNGELIEKSLIAPLAAVAHMPRLLLSDSQQIEIRHGRRIPTHELAVTPSSPTETFVAVDSQGQLLALLQERRPGQLGAVCNFC